LVYNLLKFFATENQREYFTVCTYTCFELLNPDQVLELAWRHGLTDFAMPFMIQMVKDMSQRVEHVQKKHEEREKKEEEKQERDAKKPLNIGLLGNNMGGGLTLGGGNMLTYGGST